jgi:hypothetical protein
MSSRAAGPIAAALILASATASEAEVPHALRGKSILVGWTETRQQEFPDGTKNQRVVRTAFAIYFSTAGRKFSKSTRFTLDRRGREQFATAHSRGPGGSLIKTSNVRYLSTGRFVGRNYVSTVKYESGARQITIAFDEAFRSCTVSLTHGKESGAPGLVMRGSSGRLLLLTSIDICAPNCSVKDGNAMEEN